MTKIQMQLLVYIAETMRDFVLYKIEDSYEKKAKIDGFIKQVKNENEYKYHQIIGR